MKNTKLKKDIMKIAVAESATEFVFVVVKFVKSSILQ
jgi:hypothetical protein